MADATGHVTIVVDKGSRKLLGAFIAGPGASEAIHEAVLAIKTRHDDRRARRHAACLPDDRARAGHGLRQSVARDPSADLDEDAQRTRADRRADFGCSAGQQVAVHLDRLGLIRLNVDALATQTQRVAARIGVRAEQ